MNEGVGDDGFFPMPDNAVAEALDKMSCWASEPDVEDVAPGGNFDRYGAQIP